MKKILLTVTLLIGLIVGVNGQDSSINNTNSLSSFTNSVSLEDSENEGGKESGGYELTLGGAGTEINGESYFGLDISLSSNPFERLPNLWVGIVQGAYWEPSFSGSTDLFADWNTHVWNETVYLNTGWSIGVVYDTQDSFYRTGPEAYLQYYTSDDAFIYAGANWDFVSEGDHGLRYGFGIGIAF